MTASGPLGKTGGSLQTSHCDSKDRNGLFLLKIFALLGNDLFDFAVGPRYNVNADKLPYTASSGGASVGRRLNRTHIAPDQDRDVARPDVLFTDQDDICCFNH